MVTTHLDLVPDLIDLDRALGPDEVGRELDELTGDGEADGDGDGWRRHRGRGRGSQAWT